MAKKIGLKIYTPEKLALDKEIYRVVLPDGRLNLTVIEDRAPTSLILEAGVLQILDEADNVAEQYFVDTGVVDVAENICTISTLHLIKTDKINAEKAKAMIAEEPQSAKFYEMIEKYFQNSES
jgi:F0F1-type ATP synthase epsilon subunit